jgi:hypothetical protein
MRNGLAEAAVCFFERSDQGKQVYTQVLSAEQPQLVLDTRKLAPGAYLVEVSSATGVLATEKLIVQP